MIIFQLVHPETGARSEIDCVEGTLQQLANRLHGNHSDITRYADSSEFTEAHLKQFPDANQDDLDLAGTKAVDSFLQSYVLILVDNSRCMGSFSTQPLFRVVSLLEKLPLTSGV